MPLDRNSLPDPISFYSMELLGLKKCGKKWKALCPFHNERTASFFVNMDTGSYICFGCNERGSDVLAFQMKRYGSSFKQAAKELGAWK